jgi:hypothetical protein|nr:MAG TPA: hypothetical protein [Caudoviricetes sp.]
MSEYLGTFELQPQYDGRKSFYGKAFVERWDTENGMIYVLKSYDTTVATVTPTSDWGVVPETYEVKVAMGLLSATTLRHVKEFLAQTDDVFRGVTLPWLRKAVKDGQQVNVIACGSMRHKTYTMAEL